jgi:Fe-S-cluster containining protein
MKHRKKVKAPRTRAEMSYVTTTLKGAAATMNDAQAAEALACYEHWRRECARLASLNVEPQRIAYTVHEIVEEHMAHMVATSEHGPHISCRPGCGACCHLRVDVFPQEARLLRRAAEAAGVVIDRARLARQAGQTVETWTGLSRDDRRCVFLGDDQRCQVYEHRPNACRKYAVRNDPDDCDMDKHPGGRVAIVFSVEAEIVQSAAMTEYGAAPLPDALARALEKRS